MTDLTAAPTRITTIRARLAELAELRREAERRPVTAAVVEKRVDELIAGLSADVLDKLPVHLLNLARDQPVQKALVGAQVAEFSPITGLHLAAWLDPAQLRQKLVEAAAERAQAMPEALSEAERKKQLKAMDAEEATLVREEGALLWALDDARQPTPWRADLPVELVLGLAA